MSDHALVFDVNSTDQAAYWDRQPRYCEKIYPTLDRTSPEESDVATAPSTFFLLEFGLYHQTFRKEQQVGSHEWIGAGETVFVNKPTTKLGGTVVDEENASTEFEADPIELIIVELGRMQDGWAGPATVAPRQDAILDLEKYLRLVESDQELPEIEVDPDNGSITIRWLSSDGELSFAAVFFGTESVIQSIASLKPNEGRVWTRRVDDEIGIENDLQSVKFLPVP